MANGYTVRQALGRNYEVRKMKCDDTLIQLWRTSYLVGLDETIRCTYYVFMYLRMDLSRVLSWWFLCAFL